MGWMTDAEMLRILVIKLSALGDIVQAEGAMHDIRLHHEKDEITVLTTPSYQRLMERCPWVDRVSIDPRDSRWHLGRMLKLRQRLRQEHFDRVYDLQQVGRTHFYYHFFLKGTPWMGGATGCTWHCKRSQDCCAADHFVAGLTKAGVMVKHTQHCDVTWMTDDVDDILARAGITPPFAVLIPGGSAGHPEKRWPYFAELAGLLMDSGLQVVTIPGPDEMELSRLTGGSILLDKEGSFLDIFKLAGVLKKASFVVGNDTGPTHIAVHLQVPGLALFGRHIPAVFSGIQHGRFSWIEQPNLHDLPVKKVWQRLERLVNFGET